MTECVNLVSRKAVYGMSTPGSIEAQEKRFREVLSEVQLLIRNLPDSLPLGAPDGPIARYWDGLDLDDEEGPWYIIDQAWTRTLQVGPGRKSPEEVAALVLRGPYGIQRVCECFEAGGTHPGMKKDNGLFMLAERMQVLKELIARV